MARAMRSIAVVFALLFAPIAFASPADDVAAQFVDVLRQDSLARLASLVDDKESDPHAWDELRDLVDRFDCIRVVRYATTIESSGESRIALRVEIVGDAELKAVWRPGRHLPRVWHLEARRSGASWHVSRAITEERRVAMAMVAASTPFDAEQLLRANDDLDEAQTIRRYADELGRAKDLARFEHALALARNSGEVSTEIDVLRAHAAALGGEPARMLAVCLDAERLARQSGDRDDLARALLTLGGAQWNNHDADAARRTYAAAADMVDVLDDPTVALKALQMFAYREWPVASPLRQMETLERQVELATRYRWEEGELLASFSRAALHFSLGHIDVARVTTADALRLSQLEGNRRFESALVLNLATIEAADGRLEEAARRFREALELSIDDHGQTVELLIRLASTEQTLGHSDEAERLLQRAESMHVESPGQLAAIVGVRGNMRLSDGHAQAAVDLFREALTTLDTYPGADFTAQTQLFHSLGRALAALGREDEALDAYRHAVATIEIHRNELGADAIGRSRFLAEFIPIYVALAELLVQRGAIDEAFSVAEQMKARSLREAIDESGIDASASLTESEKAREAALVARVVELNKATIAAQHPEATERQLADARVELDRYRAELRIAHPAIPRGRLDRAPALQLPAGSESLAFIEYVVAKKDVLAFVVVAGAPIRVVRLPISPKTLAANTRELENLLQARSPAYASEARRMYATLIAPLEPAIRGKTTLAIAPDGPLWTVPFQALIAGDGRYVIERHAVFYAHSLSLLRDASALHADTSAELLALGNPTVGGNARSTVRSAFRGQPLASLAEAEAEVRSLASLYPSWTRHVYYRDAASEAVFKEDAPHARIIHLAAHALVDDRAPLYSAIVLAAQQNGDDDGLLEAREIAELPLHAALTVLSACQTARGKIGPGEGVIGLSWALFAAGCPTTVVSQWDAESAATASLMIEFHRRLRAGDTTAVALRKAQRSVQRTAAWRHPFYWAPFIALGAANRPLRATPAALPRAR